MTVRKPTDHELSAEGWEVWESDHSPAEWHWYHGPSGRSITIVEAHERHTCTNDVGTYTSGHFVICRLHAEDGYPVEATMVGPIDTLAAAMRQARALRRSIMSESAPAVVHPEQLGLLETTIAKVKP